MKLKISEYSGLPKECSELSNFQTKLFILLMHKNQTMTKWELFLNGCKDYIRENYKAELNLESEESIRIFIRLYIGDDKNIKAKMNDRYLLHDKDIDNFLKLHSKKKDDLIEANISSVFSKEDILKIFFTINYNINAENLSGAEINLEKLLRLNPIFFTHDIDSNVRPEKRIEFKKAFLESLKNIWNSNIDEKLKVMFIESLRSLDDLSLNNVLDSYLGELFLSRVSYSVKNYKYCLSFPTYWLNKVDVSEQTEFSKNYFQTPLYKKMKPAELSLLKYHYPLRSDVRLEIRDKIILKRNSFNYYEMESLFKALENQVFKKFMSEKDELFKIPLFSLKKEYYDNMLKNEEFGIYSSINLMQLGYEDLKLLIWLL